MNDPLTRRRMQAAAKVLAAREPVFRLLYEREGVPPLWAREPGFHSLVHIILEQKVSLASALAVLQRVRDSCAEITPENWIAVPPEQLYDAGVSARKIEYCTALAKALVDGSLSLDTLHQQSDDDVVAGLTAIRGIGPWTANVYNMMCLLRPDAWATGDRALALAVQECFELAEVPTYPELDQLAEAWKPHRATAARLLWQAYLLKRNKPLVVPATDR